MNTEPPRRAGVRNLRIVNLITEPAAAKNSQLPKPFFSAVLPAMAGKGHSLSGITHGILPCDLIRQFRRLTLGIHGPKVATWLGKIMEANFQDAT
jgi:hypothetical protein